MCVFFFLKLIQFKNNIANFLFLIKYKINQSIYDVIETCDSSFATIYGEDNDNIIAID
jgi:hypothetical protein